MNFTLEEAALLPTHPFSRMYMDFHQVSSFFHYSPFEQSAYQRRAEELLHRSFPRQEISQVIRQAHQQWGMEEEQEKQLAKLLQPESMVVVGGQQAGLLLGPMYTIYKAITIIQLAKQQENLLGRPIVPIFWIAGEDHDFAEINHLFLPKGEGVRMEKVAFNLDIDGQVSASFLQLPKTELTAWITQVLASLPATEFSEQLQEILFEQVHKANNFVDFFALIMQQLFGKYGLLMLNSADPELRKLESTLFTTIIEAYESIDADVRLCIEQMEQQGYEAQIALHEHPALLFFGEAGERHLLLYQAGEFFSKNGAYRFSKQELLSIATETPWKLSNNVITRPYMQESLLPTLAFVAGPGEIAYWALLGKYFERLGLQLPIIAPRYNLTIIEKSIASILEKREIPLEVVFADFAGFTQKWLKKQDNLDLEALFAQVKGEIETSYQPLLATLGSIQSGLTELGEKNLHKLLEQVDYLQKRSIAAHKAQYEAILRQFDKVEQALFSQGNWQERMVNPFTFFNKHGMVFVDNLLKLEMLANGRHKFVYV